MTLALRLSYEVTTRTKVSADYGAQGPFHHTLSFFLLAAEISHDDIVRVRVRVHLYRGARAALLLETDATVDLLDDGVCINKACSPRPEQPGDGNSRRRKLQSVLDFRFCRCEKRIFYGLCHSMLDPWVRPYPT